MVTGAMQILHWKKHSAGGMLTKLLIEHKDYITIFIQPHVVSLEGSAAGILLVRKPRKTLD